MRRSLRVNSDVDWFISELYKRVYFKKVCSFYFKKMRVKGNVY